MLTHKRLLAAATVVGALALAGPAAIASAAQTPSVQAASAFHGYGNPWRPGDGGYGPGYGYGAPGFGGHVGIGAPGFGGNVGFGGHL